MPVPGRPLVLSLVAALAAWPVVAQGPDPVPEATVGFVAAVRANGCAMTEAEAQAQLPAVGLTMTDAQVAAALMNRGPLFSIDADGETLRLVPDLCAADDGATRALLAAAAAAPDRLEILTLDERVDTALAAQLIGAVRAEGCTMTDARAEVVLPGLGFDPETVQDLVGAMLRGGLADLATSGGPALTLSAALCAADPAQDSAAFEAVLNGLRQSDAAPVPTLAAPPAPLRMPSAEMVEFSARLNAGERGCVLDVTDPFRIRQTLIKEVLGGFILDAPPTELRPLVVPLVDAFLTDPGPTWAHEPGRLRPLICTP